MVPAADVLLIAGSDPRGGPIAARIRRFATRYTSLEALPLACTRTLCGEGWDVALLELDPVCDHGTTPCLTPLGVATSPPTIGMPLSAVGFGQRPARDLRQEWALGLGADGGGVRRVGTARVTQIVSSQLLRANADGEAATLLCVGDHGAALVSRRDGAWQLDGVGLMRTAAAADAEGGSAAGVSGCPEEQARAWGVHVSRCWLEATVGGWGMSPLVDAHASECGHSRESNPRALSSTRGGAKERELVQRARRGPCALSLAAARSDWLPPLGCAAGAASSTFSLQSCGRPQSARARRRTRRRRCAMLDCGAHGVCMGDGCACARGYVGPLCSVDETSAPPLSVTLLESVAVSPNGTDGAGCGALVSPCRSIRHALLMQARRRRTPFPACAPAPPPRRGARRRSPSCPDRARGPLKSATAVGDGQPAPPNPDRRGAWQYWHEAWRANYSQPAWITLLEGTLAGDDNRALQLHGVRTRIRSIRGAAHTLVDCSPGRERWGTLFARRERCGECRGFDAAQVPAGVAGGARARVAPGTRRAHHWTSQVACGAHLATVCRQCVGEHVKVVRGSGDEMSVYVKKVGRCLLLEKPRSGWRARTRGVGAGVCGA